MFGRSELFRKHRGFSLLEVMIGMTLLSVGILGLVGLQINAINSNRFGSRTQQALLLAEERATSLSARSFDDLLLLDSNTGNDPATQGGAFLSAAASTNDPSGVAEGCDPLFDAYGKQTTNSVSSGLPGYQRCWQIADEKWNPVFLGPDSKRIRVFVRFKDATSSNWHETSVTTLKTVVLK